MYASLGDVAAVAPVTDPSHPDDVPLIIILTVSILGMFLLGLNVLLILFFIRRRRKHKNCNTTTCGYKLATILCLLLNAFACMLQI